MQYTSTTMYAQIPSSNDSNINQFKSKSHGNDDGPSAGSMISKRSIHTALCSAQIIFGISAVVGTIGLPAFHPLTFALIRESWASIVLLTCAHFYSISQGRSEGIFSGSTSDTKLFLLSGFGIFASQAFYIIGIKLSSAVAASVWQPSQPLITASVCMMMGWEPYNLNRCIGIMVAFFGCAIMVVGGSGSNGEVIGGESDVEPGAFANLVGQLSFLLNCCGTSLYVLSSKTIIVTGRYESVTITAWSYVVGSIMMGFFSCVLSWSDGISNFLCSDCHEGIWHVPRSAIPAMLWFILMTSSVAYGLITWANKYATGTLVIGYSVMQPVASAILIQFLISTGVYDGCIHGKLESNRVLENSVKLCLDEPDKFTIIGAIGVFIGLTVVIFTEPKENQVQSETGDDADQIFELAERQGFLSTYDDSLVE